MKVDLTILFLGLLVFSAHLFSSIYTRKKIPDVLLLIVIGLIFGPILHWVEPEDLGAGGPVFVALTLIVILFEGGTSLDIRVMNTVWKETVNITIACFFLSMGICTLLGYLFGLHILSSLLLGAILGGTSSAVVIPLVRQLPMGEKSRTVLILESAATDVLCIVFALAFLHAYLLGQINVGRIIGNVFASFFLAAVVGFTAALLWSRIIRSVRKMQNSIFTTPAFVFVVYGLVQLLGYSGAIAALSFGITMANIDTIKNPFLQKIMGGKGHPLNTTEMIFFGEIVFILKTILFVYIGISIVFNDLTSILIGFIITIALFVGRTILARFIAPKDSTVFDKTILSMMIPKGLAAAVLATMPEQMGVEGGLMIKNVTYAVIFFSILWVSICILLLEKVPAVKDFYNRIYGSKGDIKTDANNVETFTGEAAPLVQTMAERMKDLRDDSQKMSDVLKGSISGSIQQARQALTEINEKAKQNTEKKD